MQDSECTRAYVPQLPRPSSSLAQRSASASCEEPACSVSGRVIGGVGRRAIGRVSEVTGAIVASRCDKRLYIYLGFLLDFLWSRIFVPLHVHHHLHGLDMIGID